MTKFNIKLYENDEKLMPVKANDTDAGFDLKCRELNFKDENIQKGILEELNPEYNNDIPRWYFHPGDRCLIKTGVFIELQPGWEAQVRARSGLALKYGIQVVNGPGTIDAGYRNEIGVVLYNSGSKVLEINKYDRIAQLVIKEVPKVELNLVTEEEFNKDTNRGEQGFGSSGVN